MTKINQSVRATIREVVEKHGHAGSPEMRRINAGVIRELLMSEHGIRVRLAFLRRMVERVA